MKKIIIFIAILAFVGLAFSAVHFYMNRCVINNYLWGMPKDTVISLKKEDSPGASGNTLCYREDFFGKNCNITYVFSSDDKLSSINVNVSGVYTYDVLINLMKQEYGEPFKEDTVSNTFMGVTETANYAVWKKGNTDISIVGQKTLNFVKLDFSLTKGE